MAETKLDVIIRFLKEGSGDTEAAEGLGGLGSAFENLTGLSLTSVTAMGAAAAAVSFLGDAVAETVEYAMDVKDFSMMLGTTTEEASKLIQIGDDLRISQEQMGMAFRFALNNGVTPTVEGLAELSAQMLAMDTPAERMQFAIDTFGSRAGEQMMRILEQGPDAIREMSDALEGSALIMGEDAVQAADDFRLSLDNLNDKGQEVKLTFGTPFIQMANEAIDRWLGMAESAESLGEAYNNVKEYGERLRQARNDDLITMEQYNKLQEQTKSGALSIAEADEMLTYEILGLTKATQAQLDAYTMAYPEEERFVRMMQDGAFAADDLAESMEAVEEAASPLTLAMGDLAGGFDEAKLTAELLNDAIGIMSDNMIEQERISIALAMASGQMTMTQAELNTLVQTGQISREAYNRIMEDGIFSAEEQNRVAGAVAITELGRLENLQALNQALDDGAIDHFEYIAALADGVVTQEEIIALLGAEQALLYGIASAAEAAAGDYELRFNITVSGDQIPDFSAPGAGAVAPIAMAEGGDYMVTRPTVFLAGESGPERAVFIPQGASAPADLAGGGDTYILNINEAGSRGNVIQDFAILKALTGG